MRAVMPRHARMKADDRMDAAISLLTIYRETGHANLSAKRVARACGVGSSTMCRRMQALGIEPLPPGRRRKSGGNDTTCEVR